MQIPSSTTPSKSRVCAHNLLKDLNVLWGAHKQSASKQKSDLPGAVPGMNLHKKIFIYNKIYILQVE